jgi:hypothetical protein
MVSLNHPEYGQLTLCVGDEGAGRPDGYGEIEAAGDHPAGSGNLM